MEGQTEDNVVKNWIVASVIMCAVVGSLFISESWLVDHQAKAAETAQHVSLKSMVH